MWAFKLMCLAYFDRATWLFRPETKHGSNIHLINRIRPYLFDPSYNFLFFSFSFLLIIQHTHFHPPKPPSFLLENQTTIAASFNPLTLFHYFQFTSFIYHFTNHCLTSTTAAALLNTPRHSRSNSLYIISVATGLQISINYIPNSSGLRLFMTGKAH